MTARGKERQRLAELVAFDNGQARHGEDHPEPGQEAVRQPRLPSRNARQLRVHPHPDHSASQASSVWRSFSLCACAVVRVRWCVCGGACAVVRVRGGECVSMVQGGTVGKAEQGADGHEDGMPEEEVVYKVLRAGGDDEHGQRHLDHEAAEPEPPPRR